MTTTPPYFSVAVLVLVLFQFTETTGFSLKLIPIFSPESPLFPKNLTQPERLQKMVENSIARAKNWQSQYTKLDRQNIHLPLSEFKNSYYVEVSIGTPGKPQLLVIDTGSDLTWTWCSRPRALLNQSTLTFDAGSSSSYKALPCDHPFCRSKNYGCVKGMCGYGKKYAKGTSKGILSSETFRFPSDNGGQDIPGTIFGCTYLISEIDFYGKFTGIFGLNSGPVSLITQLDNIILGRFSYCLASKNQVPAKSILSFGKDAVISSGAVKSISIRHPDEKPYDYYLDLVDISVGSRRLSFPPGTFAIRDKIGGCVIDSGSSFGYFQREPYNAIMREFDRYFTLLQLQRIRDEKFEYCYRNNPNFRAYASMTYHFDGADFVVEPAYMYIRFSQYFCVALLQFDGANILGAWQQQNTRFLYDIRGGHLKFAPENCAGR